MYRRVSLLIPISPYETMKRCPCSSLALCLERKGGVERSLEEMEGQGMKILEASAK